MIQALSLTALATAMASLSACGTPRNEVVGTEKSNREMGMNQGADMPGPPGGVPVNQRFEKLDDYLAWLRETQGPIDGPYYDEVRPGVYQLRTGNLRVLVPEGDDVPRQQTVTRAQLMKQFGFSK